MECSSINLWADHRLAVRQNYSLTPQSRLPRIFFLISLFAISNFLYAFMPGSSWSVPLFSILLLLVIPFMVWMNREASAASPCRYRTEPGHELSSKHVTCDELVLLE